MRRRGFQVEDMNRLATHVRTLRHLSLLLAASSAMIALPASAAEGGLQLLPDFTTTLPALIVVFLIIVAPLNALLFRPILKALDERDERIAGTRAKAERLSHDTQAVLERYEAAIRDAREEAEGERRVRIGEARARLLDRTVSARTAAEAELERARGELAATLDEARGTLRGQANDLAREAAASVLGRAL